MGNYYGCSYSEKEKGEYVSNTDYTVTKNTDETKIAFAFTASIVFDGVTYTDIRYIKYEYQIITLHNSNYKEYLSVGCSNTSYLVSTGVSKKNDNLIYSNVTVTFTVRMTGTLNNGSGGMGYSKTETIVSGIESKITNVGASSLRNGSK